MSLRGERTRRVEAVIPGMVTLAAVVLLLARDAAPRLFPAGSHELLAAIALATIAFAYLVFQLANRAARMELAKAFLLAAAFLFWAANQFWPNRAEAGLYNDIAIALFVLDVFWAISGWPPAAKQSSVMERAAGEPALRGPACDCPCCSRRAG